jgi:hypothetical protein
VQTLQGDFRPRETRWTLAAMRAKEDDVTETDVKPLTGVEETLLRQRSDLSEETKRLLATIDNSRRVFMKRINELQSELLTEASRCSHGKAFPTCDTCDDV